MQTPTRGHARMRNEEQRVAEIVGCERGTGRREDAHERRYSLSVGAVIEPAARAALSAVLETITTALCASRL